MKQVRNRTKAVTVLLLIALVLGAAGVPKAAAASYTDVSDSDWFSEAVRYVTDMGLFKGTSATQFSPENLMTRSMFVTVLGRYAKVNKDLWTVGQITGTAVALRQQPSDSAPVLAQLSMGATVTITGKSSGWYQVKSGAQEGYVNASYLRPRYHEFSDLSYGQYYDGYAVWAYEKGIVQGTGNNSFSPQYVVSREQVCTLLDRYAGVQGLTPTQTVPDSSFTDSGSISSWARDSVNRMVRAGVIEGPGDGTIRPNGATTRAQAATMIMRFDNACKGLTPATPSASPSPTPATPTPTTKPTPTPGATPPLESPPADTPAELVSGSVQLPFQTVRVGLFAETANKHTGVSEVTLTNTNGSGFSYGIMGTNRHIQPEGTVSDPRITITTDGSIFYLRDSAGTLRGTSRVPLAIHPTGAGKCITQLNGEYRYYGDFVLRQADNGSGKITVTNYVDVEDYVKGVVPYEISASWPAETLKAMAVAARSYVMKEDRVYEKYGMDTLADGGSQLYRGRAITYGESYFTATDAAVEATRGQYLTYHGDICLAAFSACDGGQTLSAQQVYGNSYPYLQGKRDPYELAIRGEIPNYDSTVSASHRVGMSQWGAYAMGKYFYKDYRTILGFYYTGATLQHGQYEGGNV